MTRLVSVNVGMPREVPWKGRTVLTGAWKSPAPGRTAIRGTNLAGDGQGDLAGHGGVHRAVLVYQIESYAFWRSELGRDDLEPGAFGENLTVDGLPDDAVCIGDRYRVGTAVFEVSQPRVTCFRVGLRLGEPRLPALLVARHRPGFYMRVVEEGDVGPGDLVQLVDRHEDALTITEVDALLYLPDRDLDRVRIAAACAALSPGWRQSFTEMMLEPAVVADASRPTVTGRTTAAPSWEGFKVLRVSAVHVESDDVRSYELTDRTGQPLPAAVPGQYVTLRLEDEHGRPIVRSYSLSRAATRDGYRISVKREGPGSTLVHQLLAVDSEVDVAAPRGQFTLPDGDDPLVLISAGIGITPVIAMLDQLASRRSAREVVWIHAAHDELTQVFAREVADLLAALPNSRSWVFLSHGSRRPAPPGVVEGRLTAEQLRRLPLPDRAVYCLCGPDAFMADIAAALADAGVPAASVRKEAFGATAAMNPGVVHARAASPHPPAHPGDGPEVSFARSGVSAPWNGEVYASLLELAEACDIATRWSCRTGVCHNCLTGLLAGRISYDPEPLERPEAGDVLVCCSSPAGPIVLDA